MVDDARTSGSFLGIKMVCFAMVALASSIACVGLISRNPSPYELPIEFHEMPMNPSAEYMARYKVSLHQMLCGNYASHFAMFGGVLGLALGGLGASRMSVAAIGQSVIGGALGGLLCGGIGGALLGQIAYSAMEINWETIRLIGFQVDPFIQTTVLQCLIWSCVGVGIGFGSTAPSFSIAKIVKGVQGGIIGGVMAGVIHSLMAAIFFSTSRSSEFIPKEQMELFVWAAICGLSMCIGLALKVSKQFKQTMTSGPSNVREFSSVSEVG